MSFTVTRLVPGRFFTDVSRLWGARLTFDHAVTQDADRTTVEVTAMSVGWVLAAAGKAIACIPNEVGASLLHSERVTR